MKQQMVGIPASLYSDTYTRLFYQIWKHIYHHLRVIGIQVLIINFMLVPMWGKTEQSRASLQCEVVSLSSNSEHEQQMWWCTSGPTFGLLTVCSKLLSIDLSWAAPQHPQWFNILEECCKQLLQLQGTLIFCYWSSWY